MTSVPTQGEEFSKLIHHLDEMMNSAAKLSHLARAQSNAGKDRAIADGWIAVVEMMKRVRHQLVELSKGHIQ